MLLPQVDPTTLSDDEKKIAGERLREMLISHGGRFAEMSVDDSEAIVSLLLGSALSDSRRSVS